MSLVVTLRRSCSSSREVEPRRPGHHDGNGRCGIIEGAKNEPLTIARDRVLIDNGIHADRKLEEADRNAVLKRSTGRGATRHQLAIQTSIKQLLTVLPPQRLAAAASGHLLFAGERWNRRDVHFPTTGLERVECDPPTVR